MQYQNSKLVERMLVGPYHGRDAFKRTLKMMQSETGVIVEGSLLRRFEEQGFNLDVDLDNKSVYHPESMFENLAKYQGIPRLDTSSRDFEIAISLAFRAFGGDGSLQPLPFDENLEGTIKGSKSSGAPYFSRKGEVFHKDLDRAVRTVSGSKTPDPCVCYHRVQHGDSGPKQRMVWGYPQSMTLIEATFARPLIDKFLRHRSPMAFGMRKFELASRALPITNSGVRYSFDFSKFDSSVSIDLIKVAFRILKTWFRSMSHIEDKAWDVILRYFMFTPIIMPDGNVYSKSGGVPSGSYFTQLVDSIVNYIVIQYCFVKVFGKPVLDNKILVLGDDCLVGFDGHIPLQAFSRVASELGFTMNPDKCHISTFGEPWHFLGHIWVRGVVDRDEIDVVKRAVFPEKPNGIKDRRLREFTRMISYYCDAKSSHSLYYTGLRKLRQQHMIASFISHYDPEPATGWLEFQTSVQGVRLPPNTLALAYSGLLT